MDAPIELHDIMEQTTNVVDETTYETPVASRDEEHPYMKIDTVAERMTTSRTARDKPTRNDGEVNVSKPSTDANALRKVQIFCLILLVMLVTSSVTIGVLINMMMQRTDELQLKISELQNQPEVLTGTESANIQELRSKVIQLEKDRSFYTSLIQDQETNLTTQIITIHDHSLRLAQIETEMEQDTTFRDLNISLLELETNLTTLGVAVSNNALNINQIHAEVEKTRNSLVNLTIATNSIEVDIQSDSATIEENQRRISRVELENNATDSLYQTMESRVTYLEDGLNCTWGSWTSYTPCSVTCGDGIQYRERSLEGMDTENSRHLCAGQKIDIQTCNIQPCESDCSGFTTGNRIDGVYNISSSSSLTEAVPVYCEFSSDGAWTVIQKRYDGSVDFSRTWKEYKAGFGEVNGEYWLGNDAIHEITSRGTYRLKVRLTVWNDVTKFATYTTFRISNESDNYRLTIGGYSGDAVFSGDSMAHNNGERFSTHDRDNDDHSSYNCAELRGGGGWWYRDCGNANLNGVYHHTPSATDRTGIRWYHWYGHGYSLKTTTMLIQT